MQAQLACRSAYPLNPDPRISVETKLSNCSGVRWTDTQPVLQLSLDASFYATPAPTQGQ